MSELRNANCAILTSPCISESLLYLHFKLALHNIKISCKIHANDLMCLGFLYLE